MAYMTERGYGRGEQPVTGMGWGAIPREYGVRLAPQSQLRGVPCGPGRAVAPGATCVNVSDYLARKTTSRLGRVPGPSFKGSQLGIAPAVVIGAGKAAGSLIHVSKAPERAREAAGYLARLRSGDGSALPQLLYRATQFGVFKDTLATAKAEGLVTPDNRYSGPVKTGGAAPVGPTAATTGGGATSSNVISDFASGFLKTETGGQVVQAAASAALPAAQQAAAEKAGEFVTKNTVPILLGVGLLVFLAMRGR